MLIIKWLSAANILGIHSGASFPPPLSFFYKLQKFGSNLRFWKCDLSSLDKLELELVSYLLNLSDWKFNIYKN